MKARERTKSISSLRRLRSTVAGKMMGMGAVSPDMRMIRIQELLVWGVNDVF